MGVDRCAAGEHRTQAVRTAREIGLYQRVLACASDDRLSLLTPGLRLVPRTRHATIDSLAGPSDPRTVHEMRGTCFPGRDPRDNPRFVVTNMTKTPQWIYAHVYCERGYSENRIKELKVGLQIDRTSCSSFLANQFRVIMTAMAYILMQDIRLHARHTRLARAQVETLRNHLFKVGARVFVSVRRVVFHLPKSFAYRLEWGRVAVALGALT